MILIVLLLAILALTFYLAFKYGLFRTFRMEYGHLMASEIIYLPYKGSYQQIGPLFEQLTTDTQSTFKFSSKFGFYFDDPESTSPQNCRAIVGILVNQGEQFKINQFSQQFSGYKRTRLQTTKYISHEMPYVNVLSFILMVKTVYPKINDYLKKQEIDPESIPGIMEIYKFVSSSKRIEIAVPLTNKAQFLGLWEQDNQNQNRQNLFQELPNFQE